jgi:hypothetical protein
MRAILEKIQIIVFGQSRIIFFRAGAIFFTVGYNLTYSFLINFGSFS